MPIFILILAAVVVGVAGQLIIKKGVLSLGGIGGGGLLAFFMKAAISPWIVSGILLYVLGTGVWLILLTKVDVSYAYPMLSLGYVFVLFFSFVFLHEPITLLKILGTILIVIGVSLIASKR